MGWDPKPRGGGRGGGRGFGRGQGGRSGGGGRGASTKRDGPQLPAALLRDVMGPDAPGSSASAPMRSHTRPAMRGGANRGGGVRGGGRVGRKELRKTERLSKKAAKTTNQASRAQAGRPGVQVQAPTRPQAGTHRLPHPAPSRHAPGPANNRPAINRHAPGGQAHNRHAPSQPTALNGRHQGPRPMSGPDGRHQGTRNMSGATKRDAPPPAVPRPNKRTKFDELLAEGPTLAAGGRAVNSAAAYLADLKEAREAEKRLGIKKGGALKGPADGLSTFLSGLTTANGAALPSYLSEGAAAQAQSLLAGKAGQAGKQPTAAAAAATGGGVGKGVLGGGLESDSEDEFGLGVLGAGRSDTESESEDFVMEDDDSGSESGSEEGEDVEGSDGDDDDDDELLRGGRVRRGVRGRDDDSDDMGEGEDESEDESEGEGEDGFGMSDDELALDGSGSDGSDESDGEGEEEEEDEDEEEEEQGLKAGRAAGAAAAAAAAAAAGPAAGAVTATAGARYVPPALRTAAAAGSSSGIERRVTGLLNRLAEANLSGIAKDLHELYVGNRREVVQAIISQLLQAAVRGPRATPAFATTAAALVAGVAGMAGAAELAAGFLEGAAQQLEAAVAEGDSLSAQNLVQLLASCHAASIVSTDLMYGLIRRLLDRFTDNDVQLMVTLLNARGLALRSADPAAMKEFVLAVSAKVAAVSSQQGGAPGSSSTTGLSTRARLMLELVIDIKNNRVTKAAGGGGTRGGGNRADGRAGGAAVSVSPSLAAWLRGCDVDRVAVQNIKWEKILLPNKKGMWWLPEAGDALADRSGMPGAGAQLLAAAAAGGGAGGTAAAEAAQLLSLAAGQRMNTDSRRAVFVAIMGAADVVHAHERLLQLPLKGDQQREVVRVVVDCCMHEAMYNPFYALLLVRLATHSKAHRLTTQFCMWDQYKALGELSAAPLTHLARLNATLVAKDTLTITSLKVVDLGAGMDAKQLFFWRLFFQHLLAACSGPQQVNTVFNRAGTSSSKRSSSSSGGDGGSAAPSGALRAGLLVFLRTRLGPWLAEQDPSTSIGKVTADDLLVRLGVAEAALQ